MVQVGPAGEGPGKRRRRRAQGLVEYGIIIALVAVIAIAGLVVFGGTISSMMGNLGASV